MQGCYCIDAMETVHKHAAIAPELLAIHSLTGCDSVTPTNGVGKATAIVVTKWALTPRVLWGEPCTKCKPGLRRPGS